MNPRTLKRLVSVLRVVVSVGFAAGTVLGPACFAVALVASLAQQPGLYYVVSWSVITGVALVFVALACATADASLVQCETRLRRW